MLHSSVPTTCFLLSDPVLSSQSPCNDFSTRDPNGKTAVNTPTYFVSLRVVLESALRNCDGKKITEAHLKGLAELEAERQAHEEVPFVVARVLLQDMTGVPLVVDFAAMREAGKADGQEPRDHRAAVPAHLIVDHSVQIDNYGSPDALRKNMEIEFKRNRERYEFLKWSAQALQDLPDRSARQRHLPPGQPRIRLARGVGQRRHVLPRQPRRHRLAHDDGERPRRARLGRRRHRSRSCHARPADVLPRARRGRRAPHRQAGRRRHRDRPRADDHRNCCARRRSSASSSSTSAKARRRCRCPTAPRSATWRPNTARPAAFSRSTTCRCEFLRMTGRGGHRARGRRPICRRRACSACRRKATSITATSSSSISSTVKPSRVRPAPSARPHRPAAS